jgi:hypothetical protein
VRELFVYWRLERHDRPAARAAIQRFQATLEADWHGLVARLYERADDDGSGQATLMETYARDGGIPPGLQADIVALGTQAAERWCRGPRHVEVFDALPR